MNFKTKISLTLTHASHCMTTSRPAAVIQTRVTVSPAMHPKLFYARCPSCHNHPYFHAWQLAQSMLASTP